VIHRGTQKEATNLIILANIDKLDLLSTPDPLQLPSNKINKKTILFQFSRSKNQLHSRDVSPRGSVRSRDVSPGGSVRSVASSVGSKTSIRSGASLSSNKSSRRPRFDPTAYIQAKKAKELDMKKNKRRSNSINSRKSNSK